MFARERLDRLLVDAAVVAITGGGDEGGIHPFALELHGDLPDRQYLLKSRT